MMGIAIKNAFPTYPQGFPQDVIERFESLIGRQVLGNVVGIGHRDHRAARPGAYGDGRPIVYTSADSVFQVAAHEDVVPLATLWEWCEQARAMLVAPHRVNRVIARPFEGRPGAFVRTAGRRDYRGTSTIAQLVGTPAASGCSNAWLAGKYRTSTHARALAPGAEPLTTPRGLPKPSNGCVVGRADFASRTSTTSTRSTDTDVTLSDMQRRSSRSTRGYLRARRAQSRRPPRDHRGSWLRSDSSRAPITPANSCR